MAGKRAEERDLRKRTLRKEICDYIQDQIAQGRFHPGDRVVETQLAKELNVSQAPVREAILELSAMGWADAELLIANLPVSREDSFALRPYEARVYRLN